LGACFGRAGDKGASRSAFRKAISLIEAGDEDAKQGLQWIARKQIMGDLLADSYATIKAIPQAEDRVLPLSELAVAAAKNERGDGTKP
jgi:hypothetical protein